MQSERWWQDSSVTAELFQRPKSLSLFKQHVYCVICLPMTQLCHGLTILNLRPHLT